MNAETQPESLEGKLKAAVARHLDSAAIASEVGSPPLIDTTRPGDRNALQFADIRPDPSFQATLPRLATTRDVVYWKAGETTNDVIVVGVYWLADQSDGIVFRGLIGPP
jgi:hypothetical protein